jgi:outer membrane protein OmpA-like peptidoglycan-associated protein
MVLSLCGRRLASSPISILTLLAGVWLAGAAGAEPLGSYRYVVPFGGFTQFDADSVGNGLAPGLLTRPYAGGRIGYRLGPRLSLELAGGLTRTYEKSAPYRVVYFQHLSADALVTPMAGQRTQPFLLVGVGASLLKPVGGNRVDQGNASVGVGLHRWFNDAVGARLEVRDVMWIAHGGDVRAHAMVLGAGVAFAFGATPRDSDGDGVPDKLDACPATPRGARVSANGCPLDSDGDKVFDGFDRCENTTNGCTVDARGCPSDGDADGVCDGLDACPDTPRGATVDGRGCPRDSDGDGVLDGFDRCENTTQGCTVDAKGCPSDRDGDGVCDGLDKCPGTSPGLKVDSDGCSIELVDRETELLDTGMIRLDNIHFASGKADILTDSHAILNVVGLVLSRWPELRIEVGGHTDARGSFADNQKLSQARADAVVSYLTSRFLALRPEQFTVKGYGKSRPLVPNTSALNMAKNRRVEFVVLNRDVLRREVERRRPLRKNEGR